MRKNNTIVRLKTTVCLLFVLFSNSLFAQEALKSLEEDYYDFLSIQGLAERPYLNYRTLSDSKWSVNSSHPWQEQNLGQKRQLSDKITLRVYGPSLFSSLNTAAPYGQNDGALWQGKGLNAGLSGGARLEGYGAELTFKPQLAFSQNLPFDIMYPADMQDPVYQGRASQYGYFWNAVDAPQRFGDKPLLAFDWGDTELRYTWKNLTVGIGTQPVWLGPSYLNSMLHSNNAPTYPKFDIGLRRQKVTIPWVNWYLGDIEARIWVGRLSESDFFDNNASNDHTMYHGLSFAYAPSFLPGFTLFANRICLVPWSLKNLLYAFPKDTNTDEDQKASFGVSWIFPQAGLEIYGELGVDDFVPNGIEGYIRYPFHTMLYTAGLKKNFTLSSSRDIYGTLFFEWNSMEMSQDFQFQWPYSPYFHHLIKQGYTNRGQWIGAGSGWGGNSQYLGFKLLYPRGTSSFFIHRHNPDNNFLYSKAVGVSTSDGFLNQWYGTAFKANFTAGLSTDYFLSNHINFGAGFAYTLIVNPYYYYTRTAPRDDEFLNNLSLYLSLKMNL